MGSECPAVMLFKAAFHLNQITQTAICSFSHLRVYTEESKIEQWVCCEVVHNDVDLVISHDWGCGETDTDRHRAEVETLSLLTYGK